MLLQQFVRLEGEGLGRRVPTVLVERLEHDQGSHLVAAFDEGFLIPDHHASAVGSGLLCPFGQVEFFC